MLRHFSTQVKPAFHNEGLLLVALGALACLGCGAVDMPARDTIEYRPGISTIPVPSSDGKLLQRDLPLNDTSELGKRGDTGGRGQDLTGEKWQRVGRLLDVNLAPEVITWEFYEDSTFRWRFTSDYDQSYVGAWAVSHRSEDAGNIFMAVGANDQDGSTRFEVLSYRFLGEGLQLGEAFYRGISFTEDDSPPSIPKEHREAVTTPKRNQTFSFWVAVTSVDWRSESDPPPGDPDTYELRRDGTYTAEFTTTECQFSGTWSLYFSGKHTGEIRASIPSNNCDPQGPRDRFVRAVPLTLKDTDELVLYQTAYVSIPKTP